LLSYSYNSNSFFFDILNTLVRIHTHIFMPWIDKRVTKIDGCGTIHKHTNIHNCYSGKYNKCFIKHRNDAKRLNTLRRKIFQYHFIYHESNVKWSVIKPRPPSSKTGEKQIFV
jgi:hypothetical protein